MFNFGKNKMVNLKQLHDYVKENYEAGNYKDAEKAYKKWHDTNDYTYHAAKTAVKKSSLSDYQMGYEQAKKDYAESHSFKAFPKKGVNLVNRVTQNKAIEIERYIDGYNDAKAKILRAKK